MAFLQIPKSLQEHLVFALKVFPCFLVTERRMLHSESIVELLIIVGRRIGGAPRAADPLLRRCCSALARLAGRRRAVPRQDALTNSKRRIPVQVKNAALAQKRRNLCGMWSPSRNEQRRTAPIKSVLRP